MAGALERIEHAAAALRAELARGAPPRWLLHSRFGADFLHDGSAGGAGGAPIAIALLGGGELRARRLMLGTTPVLALEVESDAEGESALNDALPVLLAGRLRMRGAVVLLAACGLSSVARAPALAVVRDWIRAGDEDPL